MRHQDPLLCSHGALAQYFFWRFHVSGEDPPSFRSRKSWYDVKVLVTTATTAKAASNRTSSRRKAGLSKPGGALWAWNETEISYLAQAQEIWRIFESAGVTSVETTHAMRGCAARAAELHGVPDPQVSLFSPNECNSNLFRSLERARDEAWEVFPSQGKSPPTAQPPAACVPVARVLGRQDYALEAEQDLGEWRPRPGGSGTRGLYQIDEVLTSSSLAGYGCPTGW